MPGMTIFLLAFLILFVGLLLFYLPTGRSQAVGLALITASVTALLLLLPRHLPL